MFEVGKTDESTVNCPRFIAFEGASREDSSSSFNQGQLTKRTHGESDEFDEEEAQQAQCKDRRRRAPFYLESPIGFTFTWNWPLCAVLMLLGGGGGEKERSERPFFHYCKLGFRRTQNFRSQVRMFLTSGYVLIACVLVKSCFLYTFKSDFSRRRSAFLSLSWHVLSDFRLDFLQQHILRNVSFLYRYYGDRDLTYQLQSCDRVSIRCLLNGTHNATSVAWRLTEQTKLWFLFWERKEVRRGGDRERRLRAANPKSLSLRVCRTWTKRYPITSQTRVKRVSRIHHRPSGCIRLTRLTLVYTAWFKSDKISKKDKVMLHCSTFYHVSLWLVLLIPTLSPMHTVLCKLAGLDRTFFYTKGWVREGRGSWQLCWKMTSKNFENYGPLQTKSMALIDKLRTTSCLHIGSIYWMRTEGAKRFINRGLCHSFLLYWCTKGSSTCMLL